MNQLFGIIFKARNILLFLALQGLCFYLIGKNNVKWDVTLFNTTNAVVGKTLESTYNAKEYVYLKKTNQELAAENMKLRQSLTSLQEMEGRSSKYYKVDSVFASRFEFILAKVANNTVGYTKNFLTINKGKLDGIEPGMGVIGPKGVVGQVMSCGDHFSRVISVLNVELNISSELINKGLREKDVTALGIGNWDAISNSKIKLTTIDKFKKIAVGDTVYTSEQNLIFPPKIMVGKVSKFTSPIQSAFWDIDVKLSTDFTGLTYVYVVHNKLTTEQTSVETEEPE